MAIQYTVDHAAPLVFPVMFASLVLLGDGSSTSVVIPFVQEPFGIRLHERNTPAAAQITGGLVSSSSFDPATLDLTITLNTTLGANTPTSVSVTLFYDGI